MLSLLWEIRDTRVSGLPVSPKGTWNSPAQSAPAGMSQNGGMGCGLQAMKGLTGAYTQLGHGEAPEGVLGTPEPA